MENQKQIVPDSHLSLREGTEDLSQPNNPDGLPVPDADSALGESSDEPKETGRAEFFDADEQRRKEAADGYFKMKSQKRAQIREENARRRADEKQRELEQKEAALKEKEALREKRRMRLQRIRKHWRLIVGVLLVLILLVGSICVRGYVKKLRAVGYTSESLVGMNYEEVVERLESSGFTRVRTVPVEDLTADRLTEDYQVSYVEIHGDTQFSAEDRYPCDTKIVVAYHTAIQLQLPFSSGETKGRNYEELVARLEAAGFVNVKTESIYDLITGWLRTDGEVKTVTVDGEKRFSAGDEYRPDVEIIVSYHTFKNKKSG